MRKKNVFIWFFILLSACLPIGGQDPSSPDPKSAAAEAFSLEELQHRTFLYFWELADKQNYQIPDRAPTLTFSSIAATGFGLTSYLVGVEHGWVSREAAAERTRNTLKVLWELPQNDDPVETSGYKGFFYHFLTLDRARRYKQVELSTIDTGLLMAGVLSAQSFFDQENELETEVRTLADSLYRRVEWDWALQEDDRLSMGWRPERGFIPHRWQGYNEAMILLVLALGSPTHPVGPEIWDRWTETYQWDIYYGYEHVNFTPLFGHQYSHMYLDFRGIFDDYMREKGIDYFENARRATLANRAYCADNPLGWEDYSEQVWGLTACDGPKDTLISLSGTERQFWTYRARGASSIRVVDDGTLAPTAIGGSLPFAPEVCEASLRYLWEHYYDQLINEYGFRDAFNPSYTWGEDSTGWFDDDQLGIDQGPIVIQLENHRSELIWKTMKQNPYILAGLRKAGFSGGWLDEK